MTLRLITKPAAFPVTVAEARAHLNIEDGVDEALLLSLITTAALKLDGPKGLLGRCLVSQTWEYVLPAFPRGPLQIPLPPLRELTTITYRDRSGQPAFLLPADCRLVNLGSDEAVELYPPSSFDWPVTANDPEAVVIRFKAGYGDPADVPEMLKRAILANVGTLYANRESVSTGPNAPRYVDENYSELISPFIVWRFQ